MRIEFLNSPQSGEEWEDGGCIQQILDAVLTQRRLQFLEKKQSAERRGEATKGKAVPHGHYMDNTTLMV